MKKCLKEFKEMSEMTGLTSPIQNGISPLRIRHFEFNIEYPSYGRIHSYPKNDFPSYHGDIVSVLQYVGYIVSVTC